MVEVTDADELLALFKSGVRNKVMVGWCKLKPALKASGVSAQKPRYDRLLSS
jgi:hypothetical protein